MILVISKNQLDDSTEHVLSWLSYFNANWLRINGNSILEETIAIGNKVIAPNDSLCEVNIVWYRRLLNTNLYDYLHDDEYISSENAISVSRSLSNEIDSIIYNYFDRLKNAKWLTKWEELNLDKLQVLNAAVKIGLKVPDTIVTTKKVEVIKFKEKHLKIITKPISNIIYLFNGNQFYALTTKEVTDEIIDSMCDTFFPSQFQELIHKKFEIRTFFIDNCFYSMAIFSQLSDLTKVDFRESQKSGNLRMVPYQLPCEYEQLLLSLLKALDITTCSLDIIKTTSKEYVFLECNPIGQFGMVSYPCNYQLEKKIAKYLIKNDKKKEVYHSKFS